MKNKSKTELKLNFLINEMNCLWGSSFIIGGGSIALLFALGNKEASVFNTVEIIQLIMGIIGLVVFILFLNAFFIKRTECIKYISQIEEKEKEL